MMIRLREDYVEDLFIQSQTTPNKLPEAGRGAHTTSSKVDGIKSDLLDTEIKITDNNEILLKKSRHARHGRPVWMVMELIKIYRDHYANGNNLQ